MFSDSAFSDAMLKEKKDLQKEVKRLQTALAQREVNTEKGGKANAEGKAIKGAHAHDKPWLQVC